MERKIKKKKSSKKGRLGFTEPEDAIVRKEKSKIRR